MSVDRLTGSPTNQEPPCSHVPGKRLQGNLPNLSTRYGVNLSPGLALDFYLFVEGEGG